MTKQLTVSLIQADLSWENPIANIAKFENVIKLLPKTDLVVLPELFTTGFTMNVEPNAEGMDGPSVIWMQKMAKKYSFAICGSIIIKEKSNYYNRFLFVTKEGIQSQYDKAHLFRVGGEHKNFSKGNERVVINFKGWRIMLQICYDIRFPVWFRNRNDYDLIINVANWPEARKHVWTTLLAARAIENQCFVLGVNRVGIDGTGLDHCGNSMLLDFKGRVTESIAYGKEGHFTQTINLDELINFKEKFPVHLDADDFDLTYPPDPLS